MFHRLKLAAAGIAILAVPGVAHAAEAEINLSSTVSASCGLGSPDITEINLHDLTGPDGKLDPTKTGTVVLGTATISEAWCNAPHSLTMEVMPMALTRAVAYSQPAYMARKVTYNARLLGWPLGLTDRPLGGGDSATLGPIEYAYAAPSPGLRLQVSRLQTLSSGGTEQGGLMLEYGLYRGTVTITLTMEP